MLPNPNEAPDDVVAVGADLAPGTVLAAYRAGMFPMPIDADDDPVMGWWSPVRRGILPPELFRQSRSLRRSIRRYTTTIDAAFADVIAACAEEQRAHGWITEEIRAAYCLLHDMGWAHSVETWVDDRLVGGLYGIAIGGFFAGESMFHRCPDASKVALAALLTALDGDNVLIDVQWVTPHLATLGAIEVARHDYISLLAAALARPLPSAFDRGK